MSNKTVPLRLSDLFLSQYLPITYVVADPNGESIVLRREKTNYYYAGQPQQRTMRALGTPVTLGRVEAFSETEVLNELLEAVADGLIDSYQPPQATQNGRRYEVNEIAFEKYQRRILGIEFDQILNKFVNTLKSALSSDYNVKVVTYRDSALREIQVIDRVKNKLIATIDADAYDAKKLVITPRLTYSALDQWERLQQALDELRINLTHQGFYF